MQSKKPVSLNKKITKALEIIISYNPRLIHKPTIVCSIDAYVLFLDYFPKNTIQLQERVAVMFLNHTQRVLGIYLLSVGGMTSSIADIRLIFSVALKSASTGIMIAHNHPSGSLKPSQTDIEITNRIK